MKKLGMAMGLVAVLMQQPVGAEEVTQGVDPQAFKGSWLGLLAGGLVAGPPGAVLGFASGAVIGDLNSKQQRLEATIASAKQSEIPSIAEAVALDEPSLDDPQLIPVDLDALQQGFRFCLGFRTGSSVVEPKIAAQLQALAQMLKAFPQYQLQIDAGADQRGSEAFNQALSQQRAEAVVNLLTAAGLPKTRMITHYQGESAAIYPEEDIEGLVFDRMVQITLLPGGES
jgi:outer membrane protein OmpA-like peptidoglycan-associated protein